MAVIIYIIYIYGHALIWLTKSLPSPSLSLHMSFCLQHSLKDSHLIFASIPLFLFLPLSTSLSLFYHLCLCRQVRREGSKLSRFCEPFHSRHAIECMTPIRWSCTVISCHLAHCLTSLVRLLQSFKKAPSGDVNIFKLSQPFRVVGLHL